MDPSVMGSDEPPSNPKIWAFPDTIPAYNLRSKEWIDLETDMIRDVSWNKLSSSHLAINNDSKERVRALITNHMAREQVTDIIESKGNGLIIILYGGPGTDKTFKAESVAEMAEKPLFRVTCGHIGTKPEDVEEYLEVGKFDEAFKSRIQLSLHYEKLDKGQRKKIWRNFLSRPQEMDKSPLKMLAEPGTRLLTEIAPVAIDFEHIDG
ncbi:uncharacterized protein EKO05_0008065 [Ascochyta rabiei]|nr:uncharacterized protein EKO05_0008065 [Ascochyta rabiei]UPX17725.1 hypothetical protein EKO05_0008065 [Ascochyta rabiei]